MARASAVLPVPGDHTAESHVAKAIGARDANALFRTSDGPLRRPGWLEN